MFTHTSPRDVLVWITFVSHAEVQIFDEQFYTAQITKTRVLDDTHARSAIDGKYEKPAVDPNGEQ